MTDHVLPGQHVIAANEGGAVGLAAGHYLATGAPAMVYMQSSGQGNAVNPLLSIADPEVYGIPMLLLVGWRGEPGQSDEPQHLKQGRVLCGLFEAMEIPFEVLAGDPASLKLQMTRLVQRSLSESRPVAAIVKRNLFDNYTLKHDRKSPYLLGRESAIATLAAMLPPAAAIVATTGHISRELYEFRQSRNEAHGRDFLTVGAMGHASQIALGIALANPARPIFCFDGDGAALMHLGGITLVGQSKCRNLKHIVFNNGAHGSVGGQPTVGFLVSLSGIARACGYCFVRTVMSREELADGAAELVAASGPGFLEIRVSVASRSNLGRPLTSPQNNKRNFMDFIHGPNIQ